MFHEEAQPCLTLFFFHFSWQGDDHDTVRNLKCKEGDEETNYSSDDWVDDKDDTENGEDEETVEDEDWEEEDYI